MKIMGPAIIIRIVELLQAFVNSFKSLKKKKTSSGHPILNPHIYNLIVVFKVILIFCRLYKN